MNKDEIYEDLKKLRENSYSPYSNFRVACIIYLKDGTIVKGVNVENAAFSPSICAERTAMSQMITLGYKSKDVDAVALYTDSIKFGSPCGVCRQVASELLDPNQKILIYNKNKYLGSFDVKEFLPYAFGSEDL